MEGEEEGWQICHIDPLKILKYRQNLLIATIKCTLRKKGIMNLDVLLPPEEDDQNWTWREQNRWDLKCSKGK